ncbi:branched-chain amino acid ABC transporter permease [Aeromicrobium sp. SMF47]|uniref:Branched-chain amino acid ABC transporter permease n=1 Tax=Aeromicrobium yanjiei TaxID=2662028 RepID=A0A5Q2MFK5_9ACTN|nr:MULTISPECIES: AzlC family ABC transporter permease [Aeromicrobium]MRJ76955.1 branched-chain amino acid ABC transporter permease [Aeromicrobium yanjiei]MRK01299.1 branched-chain amino acid ABC transporter permease [Aeromicrobium sp. S22]QGG41924.1 branched-chain amino acid ABC transporter permease [Aeromicrobium yanjiei]
MTSDRSVIVDSLGVGLATGAYGVSFGAISTSSGLSVLQTCLISLLVFTGASQFAFVGIIASGGNPLTGSLTAILLGSRNLFYGVSMAPKLELTPAQRLATAHFVIDESTAMGVTRPTRRQARLGFYWTGISIFVLWNLSTAAGAWAGNAIGDPRTYGLDAAVGAAFLGLLWPRLASAKGRLVALVGAAVALGLVPLTSAGMPIILGGGAAVLLGLLWRPGRAS